MRDSIDTISYPQQKDKDHDEEFPHSERKITVSRFFLNGLGAMGVVFGDIGTSPLYVMNTIFTKPPSYDDTIGACSLILWTLILMVSGKYMIFIMSADHHHEGGIFALCSLLVKKSSPLPVRGKRAVVILSIIGSSLLLGDGAITPAISVISAIEGLSVAQPDLQHYVVPITIAILIVLFCLQPFGTAKVGSAFGPFVLLWLISIGAVGIYNVINEPHALYAFNPWAGLSYFIRNGPSSYLSLGAIFLCVTGMEAMFADMGHFHRGPIRFTWLFIVFPGVLLNYLGQTAVLLKNPDAISAPFYNSIPQAIYWYMFVLATIAGIIASQAIVTGSFSVVSQAIWSGFAPPLNIKQTSKQMQGQIFIPVVNWALMIFTLGVVIGFRSSAAISNAYGVTVCTNEILTSVLFTLVVHYHWGLSWWLCLPYIFFLTIDVSFWGSILYKLAEGGYVAIIIASFFSIIMLIWYAGEYTLRRYRKKHDTSTRLEVLRERFTFPEEIHHHHHRHHHRSSSESKEDKKSLKKHLYNPPSDIRPSFDKPERRPSLGQPSLGQPNLGQPVERRPSLGQPAERRPSLDQLAERRPSLGQPAERRPSLGQPAERRPSLDERQLNLGKSDDRRPSLDQPRDRRPSLDQPTTGTEKQSNKDNECNRSQSLSRKPSLERPTNFRDSIEMTDQTKKKKTVPKPTLNPDHINQISEDPSEGASSYTSASSHHSSSEEMSEGVFPDPAIYQIQMNDGSGHISQHNITTLPRVGVYLAYSNFKTPLVFEIFLERVSGVPQTVIFLKINKANIPVVHTKDRLRVTCCFDSVFFVNVSFGYAEHTKPDKILEILTVQGQDEGLPPFSFDEVTLFVPADTIIVGNKTNFLWKVVLFLYAGLKSVFFGAHRLKLPPDNTIYIATIAMLGDFEVREPFPIPITPQVAPKDAIRVIEEETGKRIIGVAVRFNIATKMVEWINDAGVEMIPFSPQLATWSVKVSGKWHEVVWHEEHSHDFEFQQVEKD